MSKHLRPFFHANTEKLIDDLDSMAPERANFPKGMPTVPVYIQLLSVSGM